jgi:hypothetical protein
MTREVKHPQGWTQGLYDLVNPGKYIGNKNAVVYRSGWEKEMHHFLDCNPNIIAWASEPFAIPYIKPTDGQVHRYFPDYYVKYKDKYGNVVEEIIEVKPKAQRVLREGASRGEVIDYYINQAKWKYATLWCKERKLIFRVISERMGATKTHTFKKRRMKKIRA